MTPPKTLVLLRADGNSKIGLGHVHRLLALSQILNSNFECTFVIKSPLPGIRELILKNCNAIIEISDHSVQPDDELHDHVTGSEIVVLDGYTFDTAYQQKVKQKGCALVCIDDIHQYHFVSDVIINPAGGIDDRVYSKEKSTGLFSGPEFSLLKKPFLEAAKKNNINSAFNNSIIICLGGADPDNFTQTALKRSIQFPFTSFHIIVGEAYAHKNMLMEEIKGLNRNITVHTNLDPAVLVDVMKQCSVAVTSASGIAYEYLSVGGELYIKQTAQNQTDIYTFLISNKLAFNVDDIRVSEDEVIYSRKRQREIFDGNSDNRILKIFNTLDFARHSIIRRANESDLMTTFRWANDPESRAQSFSKDPIQLENHEVWFKGKINNPSSFIYIFEYKNLPIGQVRFDGVEEAILSYSIDSAFRGRGWGQIILQRAIEKLRVEGKKVTKIIGYVKQSNSGSNKVFKNLGFLRIETLEYPNSYKYELPTK